MLFALVKSNSYLLCMAVTDGHGEQGMTTRDQSRRRLDGQVGGREVILRGEMVWDGRPRRPGSW